MKLSKTVRTINLLVLFLCCFVARTWAQTFSVTAGLSALTIHPGDKDVAVLVSLGTDGTYSGPVTVTLTGLPSGITVTPLLLAPGASGTLLLSASVAADQEAFPASDPANADTATSTATVVAFAGAQQTTATFSLTVSLENPSFAPQPGAINLPIIRIDTGGAAIADKTTNVPGTITITSADGHTSYLPGSAGADNTATFHLHGNSTLGLPKKAYNLKLNTSADLLTSMGLQCGYVNSAGNPSATKASRTSFWPITTTRPCCATGQLLRLQTLSRSAGPTSAKQRVRRHPAERLPSCHGRLTHSSLSSTLTESTRATIS